MEVQMHIRKGKTTVTASFQSTVDALEIFDKLFEGLLDGDEGFEISLEVPAEEDK